MKNLLLFFVFIGSTIMTSVLIVMIGLQAALVLMFGLWVYTLASTLYFKD